MPGILQIAAACVLVVTSVGAASAAAPQPSYVTTVQLHDGKRVTCFVNEPASTLSSSSNQQSLSTSERNEAEIDATAALRRIPRNRGDADMPDVQCS
ncbi:hypothetical protein R69888_02202 [Paraburkholderia haematera]|jgi:hypothetical protein|uniref:Secreted protein n=1 Tax=Paraburkholderia haematera TaxID=2793077 RepID=A0ABM8R5N2_9BURK|nr:hypothetical protein R69888_02202 [Paraburkholderia haematera]